MTRREALNAIYEAADHLNEDELNVLARIARRIELGRTTYAPLDIDSDKRDWREEEHQEIDDALIYRAIGIEKAKRNG